MLQRGSEVFEATNDKQQTWRGETGSESFTAFKMELRNWVGSLHDNMMKVMDVAEAKEGRLRELHIKNAGMPHETVDDFRDMDRRLYQVLISCTKGEAKNYVCNPERSGFKAWKQMLSHFDPRTEHHQDPRRCRVPETSCRCGNNKWQTLK